MKSNFSRTGVLLPIALLASLTGAAINTAHAQQSGVAATVNSDKILMTDLNRILDTVKAENPGLTANTPDAQKALADTRNRILDNLIEQSVMYQQAQKLNIRPSNAVIDGVIANVRESYKSEAEFTEALKEEGKTVADLRLIVTKDKAIEELFNRVTAEVKVTDADISSFYQKNQKLFTRPEAASVRQIWIASRDSETPAERAKAKQRATTLAQQARTDNDFGKLAFQNSEDPVTKERGGDLGMVTRETLMAQPLLDAIFNTQVGQIAGPVETKSGYHVIKVESRLPAEVVPLDKVKEQVRPIVLQNKMSDTFDQQLELWMKQAKIQKFI